MSYKVKLNFFEGPLDLLLFLIRKERIDIYDIPISKITEQYLNYLELMQLLDLDVAGEFLVMAATLMHIKSKLLLPPDPEEIAEGVEEDPRDELVRRLLEYKKYKEAAESLRTMYDQNREHFFRSGSGTQETFVGDDGETYFEASLFDLINAFRTVLSKIPKETFHQVIKEMYTVHDKISFIKSALAEYGKVGFLSLFEPTASKSEIIATFLAMLELMKMREAIIVQKEDRGEIFLLKFTGNM
ncbi:MAG: segregation/condensation protein A [Candidatus Omnitrophica bacterium]|nr:segregation/condensation protein A [Candidatus Omnitrophota bacterium]